MTGCFEHNEPSCCMKGGVVYPGNCWFSTKTLVNAVGQIANECHKKEPEQNTKSPSLLHVFLIRLCVPVSSTQVIFLFSFTFMKKLIG